MRARESEAVARVDNATAKLDMQLSAEQGTKAVTVAEGAALPAGYREGSSAGSGFAETANLPDGYRRVINTKTGNTEVLSTDGTLYLKTADGLKPKAGGNLSGLIEAEKNIALRQQASNITAPIDFDGHVIRAEVKPNGNVVGGHSLLREMFALFPEPSRCRTLKGCIALKLKWQTRPIREITCQRQTMEECLRCSPNL